MPGLDPRHVIPNPNPIFDQAQHRLMRLRQSRCMNDGVHLAPDHLRPAAQVRDQIFEPFYQFDIREERYHEGTGLGLTICQQLVVGVHKIEVETG